MFTPWVGGLRLWQLFVAALSVFWLAPHHRLGMAKQLVVDGFAVEAGRVATGAAYVVEATQVSVMWEVADAVCSRGHVEGRPCCASGSCKMLCLFRGSDCDSNCSRAFRPDTIVVLRIFSYQSRDCGEGVMTMSSSLAKKFM